MLIKIPIEEDKEGAALSSPPNQAAQVEKKKELNKPHLRLESRAPQGKTKYKTQTSTPRPNTSGNVILELMLTKVD